MTGIELAAWIGLALLMVGVVFTVWGCLHNSGPSGVGSALLIFAALVAYAAGIVTLLGTFVVAAIA